MRTTIIVTVIVIIASTGITGYYYYEYREPRYENRASRTTVNTQIGVRTPQVIRSLLV
jgi:nitrogen regulatory protein PII-like uncharacterized protein